MKPSEKLDAILNLLSDRNNPYVTESEILAIKLQGKNPFRDAVESRIILKKLCADRYVAIETWVEVQNPLEEKPTEPSKHQTYYITFDGSVFLEKGGYTGEQKRRATKQILEAVQTWAIAIGTILAGAYALVEIFKSIIK